MGRRGKKREFKELFRTFSNLMRSLEVFVRRLEGRPACRSAGRKGE